MTALSNIGLHGFPVVERTDLENGTVTDADYQKLYMNVNGGLPAVIHGAPSSWLCADLDECRCGAHLISYR